MTYIAVVRNMNANLYQDLLPYPDDNGIRKRINDGAYRYMNLFKC